MIEFLKKIVKEASNLITESVEITKKGDDYDLVTNFDLKIEEYLIKEIKKKYPTFDIVSEEYNSNNELTENCFVIDPIDGTINFANNIPLWGIQIACKQNGKIVASVIYLPKLNELYSADETGAYLNDKKISIKEVPIKNALYIFEGDHSYKKNKETIKKMYEYSKNQRIIGAMCVSFSLMAKGNMHGVVFNANRPWDYVPGLFLCEMAGAKIKSTNGFHAAAMNEEFLNILEEANK